MCVPALYFARSGSDPVRVDVRVRTRFATTDVSGVGEGFAQLRDQDPQIVFDIWADGAVRPLQQARVIIGSDEGYTIKFVDPASGGFQVAHAALLSRGQMEEIWDDAWQALLAG